VCVCTSRLLGSRRVVYVVYHNIFWVWLPPGLVPKILAL